MARGFLTKEDLNMRLDSTICMYQDAPVYVRTDLESADPNAIVIYEMGKLNRYYKKILVTSDEFSLAPLPLGYINLNENCCYVSRIPERRQKQGLSSQNLHISNRYDVGSQWWTTKDFGNMVLGVYPTQRTAFNRVTNSDDENSWAACAFHRNFCYKKMDGNVIGMLYKERLIALYNDKSERFELIQSTETSINDRIISREGISLTC